VSIKFGELDGLRAHARQRARDLRDRGVDARLYGEGQAAQPGTAPSVPTFGVGRSWLAAAAGAIGLFALATGSVLFARNT
jgi:hypothetical protein